MLQAKSTAKTAEKKPLKVKKQYAYDFEVKGRLSLRLSHMIIKHKSSTQPAETMLSGQRLTR